MNKKTVKLGMTIAVLGAVTLTSCGEKFTSETKEGIALVKNEEGATLGYSPSSGVQILTKDRYPFKDLNKNRTVYLRLFENGSGLILRIIIFNF